MSGPELRAHIARALGVAADATWTRAGGSGFCATWRVADRGAQAFVKIAPAEQREMLAAEAAGLEAIAATATVRVPRVLAGGSAAGHAFLALEWLALGRGGRDARLGHALAALHRHTGPRFGWYRDNTIGATPQPNRWHDDWATFWVERRLGPQLALARANGFGDNGMGTRLLERVPSLLAGHAPEPSLLHGDLWSGNAAATATGEPAVFDPAVYYGDRETDLAMTELFGGFGADFDEAYRAAWPLEPGYARRRTLYNLYHVLNHFNLFGGGYGDQAAAMFRALLGQSGIA